LQQCSWGSLAALLTKGKIGSFVTKAMFGSFVTKGKLGSSVTTVFYVDASKSMDSANVYAVMNIIFFTSMVPLVIVNELPTQSKEWYAAVKSHGFQSLMMNLVLSGFCFYMYNFESLLSTY
jgi:hypothetical protein